MLNQHGHNILVCDDHRVIFQGIKAMLATQPNVGKLEYVESIALLKSTLKQAHYDLLILDLNLAGTNSLEHLSSIKALAAQIKIIIFSSYDNIRLIEKAKVLDVDAYLLKSSDTDTFNHALDRVIKGEKVFDVVNESKLASSLEAECLQHEDELSAREQEIATLMVSGFNEKELAEKLFISKHTVRTHKKNIFRKLSVSGMPGLIKYIQAKREVF